MKTIAFSTTACLLLALPETALAADYTCEPGQLEASQKAEISTDDIEDIRVDLGGGNLYEGDLNILSTELIAPNNDVIGQVEIGVSPDAQYAYVQAEILVDGELQHGTLRLFAPSTRIDFSSKTGLSRGKFSSLLAEFADQINACDMQTARLGCGISATIAIGTCGAAGLGTASGVLTPFGVWLGGGFCFATAAHAIDECRD